ncbi:putative TIR domain, P-loop containing nucleoside triphosphate hydrolase [Helianthus anomalus]
MASTSANSSIQKSFKYDVFLSFRGEDTRKNFVDHLYHALDQKGIRIYKDDETLPRGERIGDALMKAIEDSRFHIIVFSKNYASSSWCLEELVKIMECQEKMVQQSAYPIFFDVEPTEVRNQTGAVGKAFAKHEKGRWGFWYRILLFLDRFTRLLELEKEVDVERWRNALKEAGSLAGMVLKNTVDGSHEAGFIQQVVEDISLKLRFINISFDENLVGMETRVKSVISSFKLDSDDVRMIGIKGMGGGGKTTLARAVFSHMSIWFEGKSFVENVREVSKGSLSGLMELQKQILKDGYL